MKLSLKNIGPFHECTLNISDVTVIAGINDTGKSYLNKILFSVLKTLCINIESDLFENFLNFSNSISSSLKINVEEFENRITKKLKEENELQSFLGSIKDLNNNLDNFNFLNANNLVLKDILKNYLDFLSKNQEKYNESIKYLELLKDNQKNKKGTNIYYLQNLKEILKRINNNFDKIKKELELILRKDESYIYSLLSNNIFNENFNESIKNKNYLEENSSLDLLFNDSEILNISINKPTEVKFNKINTELNIYSDVTYISDTFELFAKIISQKELSKMESKLENFYFRHFIFRNDISSIFKFKSSNFESDFDFKIKTKKDNALNEMLFKDEIKSKFQNYFSLNHKINKTNDAFINEKGINIKFSNASKGLKIIEAFNQLIDTAIFNENNIIILDEPEAFLHPEWQYLFIKWLLDVSATIKNFKLIISTHSPYIIDMIESFSTRQFKKLKFSYNFLTKNQKQDSIIESEERPEKINAVLNGPFMKLENEEYEWDNKK